MTTADQSNNGESRTHYTSNVEPPTFLKPGTPAPDFTLRSTPDQTLSLSELRGHPVVLAFYPADWSPVCGDQMTLYSEIMSEFERFSASVLGISVDGAWCHTAFREHQKIAFPLLADFEPKGGVARRYGAYRHQDGVAERALFVLDENGVITWSYLSPIGVNPGADGILRALESMHASSAAPSQKATQVAR
jgi:peroxiredoxin